MPASRKRAAEEAVGPTTRAKVAKTKAMPARAAKPPGKKGLKKQASMGATTFKAHALPLHVNVTHTPPVYGDDTTDIAQADPGFIGSAILVPTSFGPGGYGWKGNKRVTIELLNSESGEKEEVEVLITINASVLGSKNAKDEDGATDTHEAGSSAADASKSADDAAEMQASEEV